jgi:lysophospholipase L1-like esterase
MSWGRGRHLRVLAVVALAGAALAIQAAPAAATPLPSSMAAIGDSITRAHDTCCLYGDHPGQSWSTGYAWYDGITSHYERLLARTSAISGHEYNDAVTGAKMSAGPDQAAKAVSQQAQYVTVLLGANDVCTSSKVSMTRVDTFASQFTATINRLKTGLPRARIFVSSIPDIYQLWKVLHTSFTARTVWSLAGICPSMLSSSTTDADRKAVADREAAFNSKLSTICSAYVNCRFDNYATFAYKFSAGEVSSLDYFHPNLRGQAALATVTWNKSWWA